MAVTLYTSREVLNILGVEDFGIYNVVAGVVVLFAFINNAMTTTVLRYLNFEMGKGSKEGVRRIFSVSVVLHIAIAVLVLLLGVTIGYWYLEKYAVIPQGRETAALWAYLFALLTAAVNILRSPYDAAIIASERMSTYAYAGIFEAVLKLVAVWMLALSGWDKLVSYSLFVLATVLLVALFMYLSCKIKLRELTRFSVVREPKAYTSVMDFFGWSLLGGIVEVGGVQALVLIFNLFWGVVVNAAMGIAMQVMNAVYLFLNNFQTAFKPQLIQLYASGRRDDFDQLVINSSKLSLFLLLLIVAPLMLQMESVLGWWLGSEVQIPEYTAQFCRLILAFLLIDALSSSLLLSAQAIGDIKRYQLVVCSIQLAILPIAYLLLRMGYSPQLVLLLRVGLNVLCYGYRVYYLHSRIEFCVRRYLVQTLLPSVVVCGVVLTLGLYLYQPGMVSVVTALWRSLLLLLAICVSVWSVGLTKGERRYVVDFILRHKRSAL